MATPCTLLAWEIPRTEEPGRLQSLGSQRVGHDRAPEHTHILAPTEPGIQKLGKKRMTNEEMRLGISELV